MLPIIQVFSSNMKTQIRSYNGPITLNGVDVPQCLIQLILSYLDLEDILNFRITSLMAYHRVCTENFFERMFSKRYGKNALINPSSWKDSYIAVEHYKSELYEVPFYECKVYEAEDFQIESFQEYEKNIPSNTPHLKFMSRVMANMFVRATNYAFNVLKPIWGNKIFPRPMCYESYNFRSKWMSYSDRDCVFVYFSGDEIASISFPLEFYFNPNSGKYSHHIYKHKLDFHRIQQYGTDYSKDLYENAHVVTFDGYDFILDLVRIDKVVAFYDETLCDGLKDLCHDLTREDYEPGSIDDEQRKKIIEHKNKMFNKINFLLGRLVPEDIHDDGITYAYGHDENGDYVYEV